jgi:hypothetical protein
MSAPVQTLVTRRHRFEAFARRLSVPAGARPAVRQSGVACAVPPCAPCLLLIPAPNPGFPLHEMMLDDREQRR